MNEWNSFANHLPTKVSLGSCCPPGTIAQNGRCEAVVSSVCPDGYNYDSITDKCIGTTKSVCQLKISSDNDAHQTMNPVKWGGDTQYFNIRLDELVNGNGFVSFKYDRGVFLYITFNSDDKCNIKLKQVIYYDIIQKKWVRTFTTNLLSPGESHTQKFNFDWYPQYQPILTVSNITEQNRAKCFTAGNLDFRYFQCSALPNSSCLNVKAYDTLCIPFGCSEDLNIGTIAFDANCKIKTLANKTVSIKPGAF